METVDLQQICYIRHVVTRVLRLDDADLLQIHSQAQINTPPPAGSTGSIESRARAPDTSTFAPDLIWLRPAFRGMIGGANELAGMVGMGAGAFAPHP